MTPFLLMVSHGTKAIRKREVELVVFDQNIDTSTPTGRLLFNMLTVC